MEKIHAHQTSTFRTALKSLGLLSHSCQSLSVRLLEWDAKSPCQFVNLRETRVVHNHSHSWFSLLNSDILMTLLNKVEWLQLSCSFYK